MDSKAREALAERVLALSRADQTEVLVGSDFSELTRFTHNAVHQNVGHTDIALRVRAIVDQRTGVCTTNVLDENSLRLTVERAIAMAKLAPQDPDQPPLSKGGATKAPANSYVERTANATPAERASMCKSIFDVAQSYGYWCAGYVKTQYAGVSILNSQGARASFDGTDCAINVKMNAQDSTGYAEHYDTDVARLDAHAIATVAAEKAKRSANPREVKPGDWTVILEPPAFGDLFAYLGGHFSAQSFDEGSSFLSDGLNKKYCGENVTVTDDYSHRLSPATPFDYEGQPKERVMLIERGLGTGIVTDNYWAHKLKRKNTGHALPAPNSYGPQPGNLVIAAGRNSLDQLIAQTQRGILISRFWYIRTVDEKRSIVTGMTRDGTFLIESGELADGVKNMRFNQSILEALGHCEFGSEQRRTGDYWVSLVAPPAKIESFTFSSGTDF